MALQNWLEMVRQTLRHSKRRQSISNRIRAVEVGSFPRTIEVFEQRVVLAAPVANDSSEVIHMNSPLSSTVGVYDSDVMDSLTTMLVSGCSNGVVAMNSAGWFTYTPDANFVGTDSFTFKANDGTSDSNIATITIVVSGLLPEN